jgi:hypothetical protein
MYKPYVGHRDRSTKKKGCRTDRSSHCTDLTNPENPVPASLVPGTGRVDVPQAERFCARRKVAIMKSGFDTTLVPAEGELWPQKSPHNIAGRAA